ncbi:MAG: YHS domain-containing protein, partial [Chthoniobacterales bacterium]|nr:YHS domain-containing protein [Chthoniobacterales bacterium]
MKTVLDPICGMEVDPENPGAVAERDGEKFYFCSEHCRQKFLQPDAKPIARHGSDADHSCCDGERRDEAQAGGAVAKRKTAKKYFCPMCDGVESDTPGSCPKCGMALDRNPLHREPQTTLYTCPMHPEIERDHPGSCPICGMALERKNIAAGDEDDSSELRDMSRRFWIGAVLSAPVFVLGMWHMLPGAPEWLQGDMSRWAQFLLSTPVVLWCGWPFFVRGGQSIVNRSLNMFTLIAMGVGASYFYSAVVMLLPNIFPPSFAAHGKIGVYFEAAAIITVLVLLGQVLELRARARTGSAIRALLDLAPASARIVRDGEERDVPLEHVEKGDKVR